MAGLEKNIFFRRFWVGQTASNLGDAFAFVAMPLLVLEATHSIVGMGTVTAVTGAGHLLGTTFSGIVVDRVNRRRLMIGCDLARLVLYGTLPVLARGGALGLGVLVAVALLGGVASNLFMVGYFAAVPNLVEPHEVGGANGRLQATQALTYVIGSATAGAVAARFGAAAAMGVNALSFAVSALSLASVRFRRDRAEQQGSERQNPWRELAHGVKFLLGERVLRSVTVFQTSVALLSSVGIGAAVIDLLIYRLRIEFHESSAMVGWCLAGSSVGAVFGAIGAGTQGRRVGFGTVCLLGTALQGVGLLIGGFGHAVATVVVAGVCWSGGLTFRAVGVTSLRQTLTPDALLGRVVASGWLLIFSASALGAVLVTHLAAGIGAAAAMAMVGGALLAVSAVGGFSPLRGAEGR
jgi:MFS family permease